MQTQLVKVVDPTQENIIKEVLAHFTLDENTLLNTNSHHGAYIRWLVFYLVKNNTRLSIKSIGERMQRSSPTVAHGIQNIESQKKMDFSIRKDIAAIEKRLNNLQ